MAADRDLKAFVGFQIKSPYHTVEEIQSLFEKLRKRLVKDAIRLSVRYGLFPPGAILWSELRSEIEGCDIALFDVSENNANVMIEVGLAYGSDKQVFLLKSQRSKKRYRMPSDLAAVYVPYDSFNSQDVVKQLRHGILTYLGGKHPPDYYVQGLWGFGEHDDVLVVCSELDEPDKRQRPEPNEYIYLSKYGDVDALVEVLVSLSRLYPRINPRILSAGEASSVRSDYTGNLVLIGGPDYNKITGLFEDCSPYEYIVGKRPEDISLKRKTTGARHRPKMTSVGGKTRITDFGFFVRMRNPLNATKRLIMIGGAHTYGVFGAAKAFSCWENADGVAHANCKVVVEAAGTDPSFAALIEVTAIESNVQTPKIASNGLEVL